MYATQIDDIATALLVDETYAQFRCRKFHKSLPPINANTVIERIRQFTKQPQSLESIILELHEECGFKNLMPLRASLRSYMNMYHPGHCGWEIAPTDRYGQDTAEGAVRAKRVFEAGDKIRFLLGTMVDLSPEELESDDVLSSHLSLIHSDIQSAVPKALVGPLRFANHHCRPNARLDAAGHSQVQAVAIKSINIGDEITVTYAPDYFGTNNQECKCNHCRPATQQTHLSHSFAAHQQTIAQRHQLIYGSGLPGSPRPKPHGRRLRSTVAAQFPHPMASNSPSRISSKMNSIKTAQIRQNIAHSSPLTNRSVSMLPKISSYILCGACKNAVPNTPIKITDHIENKHPDLAKKTGLQEWCASCEVWHARAQRARHFATKHAGEAVPPAPTATVIDPVTLQLAIRKRTLGKRSKHFKTIETSSETSTSSSSDETTPSRSSSPHPPPSVESQSIALLSPTAASAAASPTDATLPKSQIQRNLVKEFATRHKDLIARVDRQINSLLIAEQEKEEQSAVQRDTTQEATTTAMADRLEALSNIWRARELARPITAGEYINLYQQGSLTSSEARFIYTVCTMEDAREILKLGLPLTYIVVPQAETPSSSMSRHMYMNELRSKDSVRFEDLDQPNSAASHKRTSTSGKKVVAMFESDTHIVLPNLASSRQNPYSACFNDLPAYDIMARLNDSRAAGRQTIAKLGDLTSCSTFQVCSKTNVPSRPYQDHYGVVTAHFVEWGVQLWLAWSNLPPSVRQEWAEMTADWRNAYPSVSCFPICLSSGDLLIQPSRSVQATFTVEDCLTSGSQHFHSPSMHVHIQSANFERAHPTATTEHQSHEAVNKFFLILREMLLQNERWPWPSIEDQQTFKDELKEYAEGFDYTYSCDCPAGVCMHYEFCTCRILGQGCNSNCHRTARKKALKARGATDGTDLDAEADEEQDASASYTANTFICDNGPWFRKLLALI